MSNPIDLLAPVWTHMTQVQPVRGEGVYLYDAAGRRYTDFTSGIGVTNTGHCHPRVVQAIQDQAGRLIFGQMNIVLPPTAVQLAERLDELTPPALDRFFFANSGAEAIEAAVKLARAATGRRNLIVFQGSFHGRTHQTMAMTTSKYIYRYDYQPLPGAVFVAPFPYAYYYGWGEEQASEFCLKQLDQLFKSQSAPGETAAIVIEPVLGEGGYVPAPLPFLRRLRSLCDEHGILLVLDEVQTGFGRTGKFFCYEHADVEPDILVMAKGLGSGMPISAVGRLRRPDGALEARHARRDLRRRQRGCWRRPPPSPPSTRSWPSTWWTTPPLWGRGCRQGLLDLQAEHPSSAMCAGWG
jgi:4-aminobutyrate aminotransferase